MEKVEGKKQYNPNTDARLVRDEMCFYDGFYRRPRSDGWCLFLRLLSDGCDFSLLFGLVC